MVIKTTPEQIHNYFESDKLSQTEIKRILSGMEIYNKTEDQEHYFEEKESLLIGSAVDTFLTQGEAEYHRQYITMDMPKPSDTMKSVIQFVFDKTVERLEAGAEDHSNLIMSLDVLDEDIETACRNEGYYQSMLAENRVKKIRKEGKDYFDALTLSANKTVLSSTEAAIIEGIISSFLSDSRFTFLSCDYVGKNPKQFSAIDIYYQVPIYFTIDGVECKALIDILVVDHRNKIIKPYDIKTMGNYTKKFPESLRRFRYDIQGAFYTTALSSFISRNVIYSGYSTLPFTFVVESTINPGNPLFFTMSPNLLWIGKNGRKRSHIFAKSMNSIESEDTRINIKFKEIPGYQQGIELYKWHSENGFTVDRDVVEADRYFTVDWEGYS